MPPGGKTPNTQTNSKRQQTANSTGRPATSKLQVPSFRHNPNDQSLTSNARSSQNLSNFDGKNTASLKARPLPTPGSRAKKKSSESQEKPQTSQSQKNFSQSMPNAPTNQQKTPIKGILKKPKPTGSTLDVETLQQKLLKQNSLVAASDDEQIRKINFQHHLEMAHKEKKGFFLNETITDQPPNIGAILTSTAPEGLGLSLLQASVNNRTNLDEIVLNQPANENNPALDDQNQLQKQSINLRNLDWAFREFMKIQEDMIARGQIESALKNLEEALNKRLQVYPARDEGVWQITSLLGDVTVKTAVRHLNNNELDSGLNYLQRARKYTEPLPNSDWKEKPEWVSVRKSIFRNIALYHQKNEEWDRALNYFKQSLTLDNSPINPDPVGAANTQLTCAVILSKLNRFAESIDFAQSCMRTLEEQAGIVKGVPITQYKQQITKDGTKANGGRSPEHDQLMTNYAICLHLLGSNLSTLKYHSESRTFLQRAHYVALNLISSPKQDLVAAISNDLKKNQKNIKPLVQEQKNENSQGKNLAEDVESALHSIKTNMANSSYSLAADFQEQKALISALIDEEEKKKQEEKKQDDKALEYVKRFIEEKNKKEQKAIDEYREKIQKDFDLKQKEFFEKQQKQKQRKQVQETNKQKLIPKAREKSTKQDNLIESLPRNISRSAGLTGIENKAGDYDTVEKQTRIKKPEQNPAAEGAKLDNLALKYSSEKGVKNFFHKRRVNIEKVNEKLGFFGGGILDQEPEEQVTVHGGHSYLEGNPFEDHNQTIDSKKSKNEKSSPQKPPLPKNKDLKDQLSAVKLPPVLGYKLDTLGLNEEGEQILKQTIGDSTNADFNPQGVSSYKNPQTRKILENIDKKEYGKFQKPNKSLITTKNQQQVDISPEKNEEVKEQKVEQKSQIKEIPTYQPPSSKKQASKDWRTELMKAEESEDELPDTKLLIDKLNINGAIGGHQESEVNIFDLEDDKNDEENSLLMGDLNDNDVENMKKDIADREKKKAEEEAKRLKQLQKPPKGQRQSLYSSTSGSRLPQLAKRFREDSKGSPEKNKTIKGSPEKTQSKSLPPISRDQNQGENDKQSPQKGKSTKLNEKSPPSQNGDKPSPDKQKGNTKTASNLKRPGTTEAQSKLGLKNQLKTNKDNQEQEKEGANNNNTGKATYVPPSQRGKRAGQESRLTRQKSKQEQDIEEPLPQPKKKLDKDRLASLSQPKANKSQDKKKVQIEDEEKEKGKEKAKAMIEKVNRGKALNFEDYLDRDVPTMNDKIKAKLTGPLADTSFQHESITERRSGAGTGSKRSGKQSSGSQKDGIKPTKDSGEDQGATRRSNQSVGLQEGIKNLKGNALTLRGLREIETKAAMVIQKFVKGYFSRKWYINYMMRKKLGVPFSGLEFAENPFLRQFNKPNQRLHQAALQPPQLVEIVKSQADQKNVRKKSFKHGKSAANLPAGTDLLKSGGDIPGLATDIEENKSPGPRRLKKGTTPQQLMDSLQKDFLAKGLDAYSQFKKLGVDALTDENGNPTYDKKDSQKQYTQEEKQEKIKTISPRTVTVALDPLERMVPRWRGEKATQFLEVKEVAQYLDRVTRMKEYDEKQKEIVKNQQYQNMARQLNKHQITTMASFAKAHGVFNRLPNQRNPREDDEDYDPLAPFYNKRDIPGGDPDGGDYGGGGPGDGGGPPGGGGDGDGSDQDKPPGDEGEGDTSSQKKKKKQIKGLRNVPFEEEDGTIPYKLYQEFSREMIVFYKTLSGIHMKWSIQAGVTFVKDKKVYIPIRIYGEPLHARNTIVMYVMNLELLRVSSDYYQYHTHTFETIWPFILYLFNNWVRHQAQMLQVSQDKPLFGPEEFLAPNDITKKETQGSQLPKKQSSVFTRKSKASGIHENNYNQLELAESEDPFAQLEDGMGVNNGVAQAKKDYDEMLNFSSEIEYDERFDFDEYKKLVRPENRLVDRSMPAEKRVGAVVMMKENRKQLFQAYRVQLQEERKALIAEQEREQELAKMKLMNQDVQKRKILFHQEQHQLDEFGKPKKKVQMDLNKIYEPLSIKDKNPFQFFLQMHFVPLPNSRSKQYELMKSLLQKNYNEREKSNVILPRDQLNQLNEERRKRMGLLPLTVIDYNCIDRAALKIKIILDCLYMRRQLNGWTLIPRDVKEAYIDSQWQKRKQKLAKIAGRHERFSQQLIEAYGFHVVYAKQYNEQALMVERSIKKINDYKQRSQLRIPTLPENDPALANVDRKSRKDRIPQSSRKKSNKFEDASPQRQGLEDSRKENSEGPNLYEQAILLSTNRSKGLADTTSINEDDLKKGLVETNRIEKL